LTTAKELLSFRYGTNDTKSKNSCMMQRSLATRLRILRAERGLTQEQAAELAHVTPETLSDLERGRRRAYTPTLAKIAKGYGVPVEELLEEPVPLGEGPQETEREWAKDLGATLHGMSDEKWGHFVEGLLSREEISQAFEDITTEAAMLRNALRLDKMERPAARVRRRQLSEGLRDIRVRRLGDLVSEAMLKHARDLVDAIFHEMEEEVEA
jgi:transcriptional regulator with XRE-family HTH domain